MFLDYFNLKLKTIFVFLFVGIFFISINQSAYLKTRYVEQIYNLFFTSEIKAQEDLKNNKISICGLEGQNSSEWILLDLGDFVINIMSKDSRAMYDLESLWDPALN